MIPLWMGVTIAALALMLGVYIGNWLAYTEYEELLRKED
jgi:uncharacterized protein YneF (UPF0154 family)